MDRARAGPLADRLRDEIAAGKFASMTELRAAEAGRGTAYSSGAGQDVGSARGRRYAIERSSRETAEELRYLVRNDMPSGDHGQESQMRGTASLALAIAVGCMVAGCGGESTDWYTAGKA